MVQKHLSLIASTSFVSLLASSAVWATSYTYPKALIEDYLAQCRTSAIAARLSPALAQKLCDCTLKRFQARYPVERFRQLLQQSERGNRAEELIEVGEACLDEVS